MRLSFIIQFVVLIIIGCGVYRVANQYQIIEKQVNKFDRQDEQEHENIRVLQAEWAFLTNPVRLEKLARENFNLQPVDGSQMVALAAMPLRSALDAQEIQTNVASNDNVSQQVAGSVTTPVNNLPATVTPVIASAMPSAQALPSLPALTAMPVSDSRGTQ